MTEHVNYLKSHPQIGQVIAQGFAHIYNSQPKFPITYLANFLKNHEHLKQQKKQLVQKFQKNDTIVAEIKRGEQEKAKKKALLEEKARVQKDKQQAFDFKIKQAPNHEQILNQFCEWVQKEKKLTGVYIAELQNQWKKIDLEKEDGQESHIDAQAPKVVKYKAASHSHNSLLIGKILPLESVLGKLLIEKPSEEGGGEEEGTQKSGPKGQLYIPLVQQNKELTFFKYPKLGAFYAVVMRVRSYLSEKLFDSNIVKTQTFKKAKEQSDKEQEERYNKFKAIYDERAAGGADEKELQQLQQTYQKQEEALPKPKLEQFDFNLRQFVVCFDTVGLDKQINEKDRLYLRNLVEMLRNSWQNKERELLQKDIDSQLKVISQNNENPLQQLFNKMIQQQQKELSGHEQVQKVKTNEKLLELEMNTLKIQKIKEYIVEQKFVPYFDIILDRRVLKYQQIMKIFYLFAGFKKEDVNFPSTNVLNWFKSKTIMTKEGIFQKINTYSPRGSKPNIEVKVYTKWQRIIKALEKYDPTVVAAYNIVLAFILRFLILCGKVRIADNQSRRAIAKQLREQREQKIKQATAKQNEKMEKMQVARLQAQGKEQQFDSEAWLRNYEQQNPQIEIGEEIVEQGDNDLQQIPAEQPQA